MFSRSSLSLAFSGSEELTKVLSSSLAVSELVWDKLLVEDSDPSEEDEEVDDEAEDDSAVDAPLAFLHNVGSSLIPFFSGA